MNAAIILVRGGSKGIPDKNIINFCGKPLIYWTIKQTQESKCIDKIYVSTDSEKIKNIIKKYNVEIIDRPAELATDTAISDMALLHAISEIEKKEKIDNIINLQVTSPLRLKYDIDNAFKNYYMQYDSLFSCSLLEDVCIWNDKESITYNWEERGNRQDRKPLYLENGSIYIFKKDLILKTGNRLGGKIGKYIMQSWQSFEIDTKEDIDIVKYYMENIR